jgi:hypothetical protein
MRDFNCAFEGTHQAKRDSCTSLYAQKLETRLFECTYPPSFTISLLTTHLQLYNILMIKMEIHFMCHR